MLTFSVIYKMPYVAQVDTTWAALGKLLNLLKVAQVAATWATFLVLVLFLHKFVWKWQSCCNLTKLQQLGQVVTTWPNCSNFTSCNNYGKLSEKEANCKTQNTNDILNKVGAIAHYSTTSTWLLFGPYFLGNFYYFLQLKMVTLVF